jgi:hypothetical protein
MHSIKTSFKDYSHHCIELCALCIAEKLHSEIIRITVLSYCALCICVALKLHSPASLHVAIELCALYVALKLHSENISCLLFNPENEYLYGKMPSQNYNVRHNSIFNMCMISFCKIGRFEEDAVDGAIGFAVGE